MNTTTTPTASPELPDLDRDLIREVFLRNGFTVKEGQIDLKPYVYAAGAELLALARRAQPDGEAPQAELVADANRYVYLASTADWSAIEDLLRRSDAESATELKRDLDKLIDTRLKSAITLPVYTAPAAQHAEIGAVSREAFDAAVSLAADTINARNEEITDLRAALAAQSQGAQALPTACAGDPDLDAARWAEVFYRNAETFTVRDLGIVRAAWKEATRRAALAAKAEAPADDPYALEDDDEVRFPNDTQVAIVSAKRYYELRGFEERAQQAAAPGALALLNTDELAALRRFYETCQDGEGYDVPKAMMQRLAEIGVVRRTSGSYYETTEFGLRVLHQPAPSAPGTPEAPADRHPIQPLVEDAHGRVRFKRNAIVDHLATNKLNDLAMMDFPAADWEQLAQLIGYSLDGFGTLSYVTDETYERAAAQPVIQRAAQLDGGQGEGEKA